MSAKRSAEIIAFGRALRLICKTFGVELYASPDGNFVEVVDLKRKVPMPEGYEFDALFGGCDPIGVFRLGDDGQKQYQDIEIEDLLPEDGGPIV